MLTDIEKLRSAKVEAEFRRMEELIRNGNGAESYKLESRPFHFTISDGKFRHLTVFFVCHNLNAGEHDGKDPGIKILPPNSRLRIPFVAHFHDDQICWQQPAKSKIWSTEELVQYLHSFFD